MPSTASAASMPSAVRLRPDRCSITRMQFRGEEESKVAIAIRPDGEGLPAGKGDYATGKKVYETTCSACHGENLQGVAGLPNMPSGQALRLIGGRGTLA